MNPMRLRSAWSGEIRAAWRIAGSASLTVLLCSPSAFAAAPLRSGQPYAEATKCAEPNVIFCEDFNYPQNFIWTGEVGYANSTWINAGLTNGIQGYVYGLEGRRINPATDYPAGCGRLAGGRTAACV